MSFVDLEKIVLEIKTGNTVLYPTDTIWGIGGDSTNESVIDKIYRIKERSESKSLITLVNSTEMLKELCEVSNKVDEIISAFEQPTTIIYDKVKGIHPAAIAKDGSAAIRVVNDPYCNAIIQEIGVPLLSTSANISGSQAPKSFKDISSKIKSQCGYISEHRRNDTTASVSSRIIKVSGNEIIVIRE